MHRESDNVALARRYLRGERLPFPQLFELWKSLKEELEFGYARQVLALLRQGEQLLGDEKPDRKQREKMCQQHALCTSKDPDLSAAERHDAALEILDELGLEEEAPYGGSETLGIAGGICKRKWEAFGQTSDLKRSLGFYERGWERGIDEDYGYTAINTAFVIDLLVHLGESPDTDRQRAGAIRRQVLDQLPPLSEREDWLEGEWWFYVTLAEAALGLGEYDDAEAWVEKGLARTDPPLWEFETTARQFVALTGLLPEADTDPAGTRRVIAALVADHDVSVDDVIVGRVGLALSGGGFRASLYHLGVLARLAELDVLRFVEVLSCVSGGSIIGALYFLALRSRLLEAEDAEIAGDDYVEIVRKLIRQFKRGMKEGVLEDPPEGLMDRIRFGWRALQRQGAMDPELVAERLETAFYRAFAPDVEGELWMDAINVTPAGHDEERLGRFHPRRHNWLRRHKVPALVLNATTVNTGHCWQFTTMSMGETPFVLHDEVDGVPRLRRAWYRQPGRQIQLGRAVAASAAVPGIFQPLELSGLYPSRGEPYDVRLVDGGVFDNQGLMGLLAADCNVLIVSDAAGQLTQENDPPEGLLEGAAAYAARAVSMLMERIRQNGYSELETRLQAKMLRGLMFIHMKDGLYAEPVGWVGCQESYQPPRLTALTDSGVRRDFQARLASLRTHLDDFNPEADYLMACGYKMAESGFADTLAGLPGLGAEPQQVDWEFTEALDLITSTDEARIAEQKRALATLARGESLGDEEG